MSKDKLPKDEFIGIFRGAGLIQLHFCEVRDGDLYTIPLVIRKKLIPRKMERRIPDFEIKDFSKYVLDDGKDEETYFYEFSHTVDNRQNKLSDNEHTAIIKAEEMKIEKENIEMKHIFAKRKLDDINNTDKSERSLFDELDKYANIRKKTGGGSFNSNDWRNS